MTLELQVTSLALSQRLKDLGVAQESYFTWHHIGSNKDGDLWVVQNEGDAETDSRYISAFTVAELGELLPRTVNVPLKDGRKRKDSHRITYAIWENGFQENYKCGLNHNSAIFYHNEFANTEADARAKMLIYLIENKLIEV